MTKEPIGGHDGPYAAPLETAPQTVSSDWIDYNGHMNVAYYTMAIDQAIDRLLEDHLGIGEAYAAAAREGPYALQSHIHYLGEMLEGQTFHCRLRLLDHDAKRMHIFVEFINGQGGVAATCEQLLMNVDLEARRSTPYAASVLKRLDRMKADHAHLTPAAQIGQPIGIRRKS
ncbi:acyl-CoA thioester hydrolase [Rubricella aquisinus]|uniref:Acyl-CoA thioester hydrolase n=1 Tax=Rubricella aquisinus TaxID=2028108 RepID=A0A840WPS9_9RHOB|nr:thioesterase family protein [Rubricella aquisinus]MBB5516073.1 acyl-CoA thioester hydrolase [Rubricella aquisinus]